MKKTHNPDYRNDILEDTKKKINNTMHNTEIADEIISKTNNVRLKNTLREKNQRRKSALNGLREDIKDP